MKKAEDLGEALANLHTRCLQMDARGEKANNELSTLVSVLLTHTDGLKGLTHELDDLLKQYQNLLPTLVNAWPLKAELSSSLAQWAADLATLKQQKNIGLLMGRLAKPEMGALEQSGLLPLLKNQLKQLPTGSPYLELLAKHPNEQVRGLVPTLVPALVPEPAQPTEPATDLAPAGLKRTPSETALAQFPAVNVPHTALAKVRYTALAFEAVKQGDLAKLYEYLSLGLNPLVTNDSGHTLLHLAAGYGQVTVLRWLATVPKLPLEVGDKSGRTPLHFAALIGQLQAMAALVDAGADKHAKGDDGNQAIHLAALFSNADAVKFCRDELGQSLEARGFNGRTPMLAAAEKGNLAVMR